jgi:hypothetical protein
MAGNAPRDIDPLWHALPVEQVLQHFELDPQQGLAARAVQQGQARHGPNALPEAPPKPLWRTFARQFKSPLNYILFAAVALGHHGDAAVILLVVRVHALIGSFQEGRAGRSMAALRRLAALHVRVQRNRWLAIGLSLSLLLHAVVLYAPPMNALFHTVALQPESLPPLLALASGVLWAEELRKRRVRRTRGIHA